MNEITFESRANALKDIRNLNNALVISFNDTVQDKEEIEKLLPESCSLVALVCKDDDSDFTQTAGINIVNAIDESIRLGKSEIYVHCWAGISRSAAVAVWANDYLELNMPKLNSYGIYNKHIYTTLRLVVLRRGY
jgi:predicted protein tyrosine phosphatase